MARRVPGGAVSHDPSELIGRVTELERTLVERDRAIARLEKIRSALIGRAVRSSGGDVKGYGLLESQVMLSTQVRRRTHQLEQLNEELRVARDAAEAAARARTTFLSTMSHEIRTPLNGILGMTTLLTGTRLSVEQAGYADTIRTCGNSLLELINDILDFTKLESRGLEAESLVYDPRDLINEVGLIVSDRVLAKGLRIHHRIDAEVPPLVVGDPGRLRQVLLNLVGNAVKFTRSGTVTLHLETHIDSPVRLCFRVVDTGVGIPSEALPRLFHPFVQADASTTRQFGGTGLGLAISRQLVELLGGEIGVESEVGRGSTFWFTVPVALPDAEEIAGRAIAARQSRASEADRRSASGCRVLVVEDNSVNQRVATALLKRMGATVDVAANGREAVDASERIDYDIILMDCQMPVMDGYQATGQIRARESNRPTEKRTPIVALTAHAMPGDSQRCLDAGMDDYITKPVSPKDLSTMLEKWARRGCGDRVPKSTST
jgi:signal transduction histidine kinase/ActR/RegA family two-component response regulator